MTTDFEPSANIGIEVVREIGPTCGNPDMLPQGVKEAWVEAVEEFGIVRTNHGVVTPQKGGVFEVQLCSHSSHHAFALREATLRARMGIVAKLVGQPLPKCVVGHTVRRSVNGYPAMVKGPNALSLAEHRKRSVIIAMWVDSRREENFFDWNSENPRFNGELAEFARRPPIHARGRLGRHPSSSIEEFLGGKMVPIEILKPAEEWAIAFEKHGPVGSWFIRRTCIDVLPSMAEDTIDFRRE